MRSLFLFLLFICGHIAVQAQWQAASNPVSVGTELFGAHLVPVDAQVAWFANTSYFAAPFTTLLSRTTDGGKTWQNVGPAAPAAGRFTRSVVEAVDSQHAWVINEHTEVSSSPVAKLYYTSDGGASWTQRPLPEVTVSPKMLHFSTLMDGLLLDIPTGRLYRTTDGGQTWNSQTTFPVLPAGQVLSSLHTAEGILWVTVYTTHGKPLAVCLSTDRGNSWQARALPTNASIYGEVVFRDAQHALLSSFSQEPFQATTDGGLTWQNAANPPVKTDVLTTVPGSRAYIAGARVYGGGITSAAKGSAITYDEGQTWTSLESTNSYLSIQFTSPTAGWQVLSTIVPAVESLEYLGIAHYTGTTLAIRPTQQSFVLDLFPNPSTTGYITMQLPTSTGAVKAIRVIDMMGRVVYQAAILPIDKQLNLSKQPKGNYLLEIQTQAGFTRRQLLLQ
ncbi:T9SS type A sorting domain-containing protein [Hymenobacter guriensis]|uniref:T9SS type A sorting domain-containing protein n=1 Tax=Hymenobacter guriensis TaxID=2793065 RepID=A0ABS0L5Y9_9BACT|nr:T9SS type A sorting domain-containing protein [Hymenobacter guriensis]MBG8555580.1 T9SS type A sorting domain-containing protein [Hymenobacter guriensis]